MTVIVFHTSMLMVFMFVMLLRTLTEGLTVQCPTIG